MNRKSVRRVVIGLQAAAVLLFFVPVLTVFWLICGLIEFWRNKAKSQLMFSRYFLGNGIPTWVLSPVNLLVDLMCFRNPGIYKLEDFPDEYRKEIELVLGTFRARKEEIIATIDQTLGENRRGMYVYQWFGKRNADDVPEFNRDFRYVKTIAVSVFKGKESTSWHYGPLRLSIRVLLNLTPADSDRVFIECNGVKHLWRDDPLFMFDDTLFHRSVNEVDAHRYNVFMDVVRPSPFPGLVAAALSGVSYVAGRMKSIFYKNWTMLGQQK